MALGAPEKIKQNKKTHPVQRVDRALPPGKPHPEFSVLLSSHQDIRKAHELKQFTDQGAEFAPHSHIPPHSTYVTLTSKTSGIGPILGNTTVHSDAVSTYTVAGFGRNGWNRNSASESCPHVPIQTKHTLALLVTKYDLVWL